MNYFIGVDVGSGSARAGVYSSEGKRLAMAVSPIQQFRPQADYIEQSSDDIWTQVCHAVKKARQLSGLDPEAIKGIGFDATCSLVALDAHDQPVSVSPSGVDSQNIVMWMDHRAIEQAQQINLTGDPSLKYVGGEVSVEMELPKILWLKQNLPNQYQKTAKFFDLADFLVYKATGKPVRSVCTKSCKWNYLSHEQRWATGLLEQIDLLDLLEEGRVEGPILEVGSLAGHLSEQAASELGLVTSTAVATGLIDAHAGALAIMGDKPESTLAIISGTSACHMAISTEPLFVEGVWGPYWGAMLPNTWLLEGGQSSAGALVDHVIRDAACHSVLKQSAESEGCSVYELLNKQIEVLEESEPYLTQQLHLLGYHHGNRSPRADPTLKGMMSGLSLNEDINTLAIHYLAAIQSVAYGTRHIIEAMRANGHRIEEIHMCGGGVKNPLWLREHADITGCPVVLPSDSEAVLLGSAMLGAAASGHFSSLPEAIEAMSSVGARIEPRKHTQSYHAAKYQVFLEMYEDQMKYRRLMKDTPNFQ